MNSSISSILTFLAVALIATAAVALEAAPMLFIYLQNIVWSFIGCVLFLFITAMPYIKNGQFSLPVLLAQNIGHVLVSACIIILLSAILTVKQDELPNVLIQFGLGAPDGGVTPLMLGIVTALAVKSSIKKK